MFQTLTDDWPPTSDREGAKIQSALAQSGAVRHDILVDKKAIGKLIGPGGSQHKEMVRSGVLGVGSEGWGVERVGNK